MNKLDLAKTAVNFIVGAGVSKIASDIIRNNSKPQSVTDTITTVAGGFVLGSMVADAATKYVSTTIDETVAKWRETKTEKSS